MAKQISENDLKTIIEVVSNFPEGAVFKQIFSKTKDLTVRNLYYRLNFLIKQGRLLAEGRTHKRYKLPLVRNNNIIPLSPIAEFIQAKVTMPFHTRPYVPYNRNFLDEYQPNVTHYLSLDVCENLLEQGKSPDGERPAGTYAKEIFNRLLIDLSWNSSRLEGNTYSLLETERLFELGEAAENKNFEEALMILNHKAAIEFLVDSAEMIQINRLTIFNLHALLSNGLISDPSACGNLRSRPVRIGKSVYCPPETPHLLDECFSEVLDKAKAIVNPFEQSFFLMVHLPYLQPFEDVNKRVSRLAANIPFIRQNLCPLSFVDVPDTTYINGLLGVYELNRIELLREVFVWAYLRSCSLYTTTCKTFKPDPFRFRYREVIAETIVSIVQKHMDKTQAIATIRKASEQLPQKERMKFIEIVEKELMNLTEGNVIRYHLNLSEFENWKRNWH